MTPKLQAFAMESNAIENIHSQTAHDKHAQALAEFLNGDVITVGILTNFVGIIQPNAKLRVDPNCLVSIGGRIAPAAPKCLYMLDSLLERVNEDDITPGEAHAEYEYIHPFTDGNGRSGRALWLWMMTKLQGWGYQFPFLQMYYYQTLGNYSSKREG